MVFLVAALREDPSPVFSSPGVSLHSLAHWPPVGNDITLAFFPALTSPSLAGTSSHSLPCKDPCEYTEVT